MGLLAQQSPTFLAPGTGFVEDKFSMAWGGDGLGSNASDGGDGSGGKASDGSGDNASNGEQLGVAD